MQDGHRTTWPFFLLYFFGETRCLLAEVGNLWKKLLLIAKGLMLAKSNARKSPAHKSGSLLAIQTRLTVILLSWCTKPKMATALKISVWKWLDSATTEPTWWKWL